MNKVQIAVLGATLVAFGGAYVLFNSAPAPAPQRVAEAPKLSTDEVLVAAQDIPMGTAISDASVAGRCGPKRQSPNS